MSDELALFGADDSPTENVPPVSIVPETLPDWQVAAIRSALDRAGLVDVQSRQKAVERLVGRQVESLRALTAAEATQVRDGLVVSSRSATSAWDDRDEDTWIDRL